MRASGALGRAFLLLHKCFETEPQCLGPSFLTRDGMLRLCADYELAPLPRAATSVPRPREQRDPHDPQGSGPLRSPFPRRAAPPHPQEDRTPGSAPARPRLPRHASPLRPGLPRSPIPRAPQPDRKPQVGGPRGAHLRKRRGALRAGCRGGGGGHVVGPLLLRYPGTPLSPPRASCPQMWDSSGKKFGCGSGTPSAALQYPPRAASPCAAVATEPARCPPGRVCRGRARLR